MSELSPRERQAIASARAAWEPAAGAEDRVLAAVLAQAAPVAASAAAAKAASGAAKGWLVKGLFVGLCCYGAGQAPYVSTGMFQHPPFTHCISDPAEAVGLTVGRIITTTDSDVYFGLPIQAKQCCSKKLQALGYTAQFCGYGMWEIRCTP